MYKKTIKSLLFFIFLLVICIVPAKALICTIEANPEQKNYPNNPEVHGLVDWWNAHLTGCDVNGGSCKECTSGEGCTTETDSQRFARQKKELDNLNLLCKYEPYYESANNKGWVEIYGYKDGTQGNQYFAVRRMISYTKEEEIYMLYCYSEKPDSQRAHLIDLPSVPEEYYSTEYAGQMCFFDGENTCYKAGTNQLDSVSSNLNINDCPTYAGVATKDFDGVFSMQTLVAGDKVLAEQFNAGVCVGTQEGYDCAQGFDGSGKEIIKPNPIEKYIPKKNEDVTKHYTKTTEKYEKNVCNMVSTLRFLRITRKFIQIAKIIVPLILIIMLSIDVYKCMIVNGGDFAKIKNKVIIRVGIALAVFFIPILINVLVNLAPKKDTSPFYFCRICFFGDSYNSYRECEEVIANSSKYVYDTQYDVGGVEDKCTDQTQNGYDEALKNTCGINDGSTTYTNCAAEFDKTHKKINYYYECRCADKDFNGYNTAVASKCGNDQNTTAYRECKKAFDSNKDNAKKYYEDCIERY